eukprot:1150852-Pelagomonas_calceolata.AAC.2
MAQKTDIPYENVIIHMGVGSADRQAQHDLHIPSMLLIKKVPTSLLTPVFLNKLDATPAALMLT